MSNQGPSRPAKGIVGRTVDSAIAAASNTTVQVVGGGTVATAGVTAASLAVYTPSSLLATALTVPVAGLEVAAVGALAYGGYRAFQAIRNTEFPRLRSAASTLGDAFNSLTKRGKKRSAAALNDVPAAAAPAAAAAAPRSASADVAARQEAVRQEAARQEAARAAAARREAARQEAARQEAARQEAARQEAARQEAARQEAARQEAARQEAVRQEAVRQEAARQAAAVPTPAPVVAPDVVPTPMNVDVAAAAMTPAAAPVTFVAPENRAADNAEEAATHKDKVARTEEPVVAPEATPAAEAAPSSLRPQ